MRSKDVAWILDMSPDDVIDLVKKGKLKGEKIGRFWRFREADVSAYKKKMERQGRQQGRGGERTGGSSGRPDPAHFA